MSVSILTVGVGKDYSTINAAIAAANEMGGNADIQIDAGTYVDDGGALWDGVNNVTIEGVGGDATIVDPNYNAGGKAAIVTGGQNIVLATSTSPTCRCPTATARPSATTRAR